MPVSGVKSENEATTHENYLELLPDELLTDVFARLNVKDLIACSHVSKRLYNISNDEPLWRKLNQEDFSEFPSEPNVSFRLQYVQNHEMLKGVESGEYRVQSFPKTSDSIISISDEFVVIDDPIGPIVYEPRTGTQLYQLDFSEYKRDRSSLVTKMIADPDLDIFHLYDYNRYNISYLVVFKKGSPELLWESQIDSSVVSHGEFLIFHKPDFNTVAESGGCLVQIEKGTGEILCSSTFEVPGHQCEFMINGDILVCGAPIWHKVLPVSIWSLGSLKMIHLLPETSLTYVDQVMSMENYIVSYSRGDRYGEPSIQVFQKDLEENIIHQFDTIIEFVCVCSEKIVCVFSDGKVIAFAPKNFDYEILCNDQDTRVQTRYDYDNPEYHVSVDANQLVVAFTHQSGKITLRSWDRHTLEMNYESLSCCDHCYISSETIQLLNDLSVDVIRKETFQLLLKANVAGIYSYNFRETNRFLLSSDNTVYCKYTGSEVNKIPVNCVNLMDKNLFASFQTERNNIELFDFKCRKKRLQSLEE